MTETSEWPKRADTPQADIVASTAGVPPSPGALHGEAWLILQTRDAHRLALGRRAAPGKPRIIGLPVFGSQASVIYDCARLDDPYAISPKFSLPYTFQNAAPKPANLL